MFTTVFIEKTEEKASGHHLCSESQYIRHMFCTVLHKINCKFRTVSRGDTEGKKQVNASLTKLQTKATTVGLLLTRPQTYTYTDCE